jgi:methionyl-tRNA synthetase
MPKTFYITTAIDYTNSAPHVGHAYEKVLADVIARYHRLKGEKVFFLTGVDQHGQKVQQSAEKEGVPPEQFVAGVTEQFVALWDKLDVRYDGWAATTDPLHKKVVQGMLQRLFDEGQIYKDKQSGYYSVRQEQFLTDKERGPDGEFGPEWGQVEYREEENYYFRLSKYKDWLLEFLRSDLGKDFVTPSFRQTELVNALEKLSGDLCISRPKSRLSWGVELPFDPDYVNYVWFDALSNYISFIGYDPSKDFERQSADFREKWPALHIVGKDIMVPAHGIYWPIMLKSVGFPDEQMPKLLVHGWWNLSGAKMSKSAGNVVDPNALVDKYGAEALRYYLMSEIVTGMDADFSEPEISTSYNSDLANNIGNLLNRSLSMAQRYTDGLLKWNNEPGYSGAVERSIKGYMRYMDSFLIGGEPQKERDTGQQITDNPVKMTIAALGNVQALANSGNRLIEEAKPWAVAKKSPDDPALGQFAFTWAELLRILAVLISPVLPKAAHGIFDQLNWKMESSGKEERFSLADAEWGKLPDGHVVGKPVPLFPRIESDTSA